MVVPDFHCNDPAVALLKNRVEGAKPLGLIRVAQEELMVIYDSKCDNSIMLNSIQRRKQWDAILRSVVHYLVQPAL